MEYRVISDKLQCFLRLIWTKGAVHIFAGSFLTKLVSFFGSIFLVRVLSKQDYGILGYLENIYGYIIVLAGVGLSNTILRYVVLGKTITEKYSYFIYASRSAFIYNIFLVLFAEIINFFYPHPEAYEGYTWLLGILFLGLPFQYITDNILCVERAMFANQRYAILSLILSTSIISSKIISGKTGGIKMVVFTQVLIYLLVAMASLYFTKKKYFSGLEPLTLSIQKKKEVLIYSFQYMITNGLWAIFMLNDVFIIGRFAHPMTVAEYKVAYAIPGSISIFSNAIGVFVGPYFVRNENNNDWIKKNFARVYIITAVILLSICMMIAVLASPIVWLLYGENYLNIVGLLRVLLIAAFCNCGLRYTTANILAAMGKVKYNMMVSALGMLLQVGIDILVAPVYGSMGIALVSCGVYLFMAVSLFIVFIRQYYIK